MSNLSILYLFFPLNPSKYCHEVYETQLSPFWICSVTFFIGTVIFQSLFLLPVNCATPCVSAWAKGFDQDTLIFSMIVVTGLIPQFRKPENFWKGR